MELGTPPINLTDSVQVGHNAVGPSTGDIVINSGSHTERCSMCKTPIDASTNPGLYCFKEGCGTLFCSNCESFFRADRRPGQKPYCAEHIAEFVGASIPPPPPPGINPAMSSAAPKTSIDSQTPQRARTVFVGQATQSFAVVPGEPKHPTAGFAQYRLNQSQKPQHNPYLNLKMVDPRTALHRTLNSWDGHGRCQRSEYWLGILQYYFLLVVAMAIAIIPISFIEFNIIFLVTVGIVAFLFMVGMIPMVSQHIRRLHDIGLSGWWFLLVFFPYVGPFALFVMSLLPSEPHPNRYG